jgi:hypothetical protein
MNQDAFFPNESERYLMSPTDADVVATTTKVTSIALCLEQNFQNATQATRYPSTRLALSSIPNRASKNV